MDTVTSTEQGRGALEAYRALLALQPEVDRIVDDDTATQVLDEFAVIVERYVFCLSCGSRHPGEDNYCSVCGQPLRPVSRRRGRFEHRELTVALDLATDEHRSNLDLKNFYDKLVHVALAEAAEDGWIPAGPISLDSLERQGRVRMRERGGFAGPAFVYQSVRIRMKRPRQGSPSSPHGQEVAGLVAP